MDEKYYLGEGKFTKFNKTIENAFEDVLKIETRNTLPGKISFYLSNHLKLKNPRNTNEFRQRSASEIIESGYYNSCSDSGLVFVTLSRFAGIPTKYIETIEKDNLIKKPILVSGHAFAEVFLGDRWIKYEPHNGFLNNGKYLVANSEYIKTGEGLDFSELKLNNGEIINLDSVDKIRRLRNDTKF